ncbi:flavin reductase [Micromonospora echinofusca]|uniref:Flavin reductase n=2 Tax=Micromonospora echinofusca TaxID=47858 RepID=A0ABS3VJH2_MICEH|nr:flavin reductase [Micromonospora echinofusca]
MSHWPTGVTVVTSVDDGQPVGCTVNAMMSVSLAPPLLVVALDRASRTLAAVERREVFGVNVLAADQRELCRRFAAGPARDRFAGVGHHLRHGVPVLSDVVAAAVCRVRQRMACGDHVLLVGLPVWHQVGDGTPLLFHRRGYHGLDRAEETR